MEELYKLLLAERENDAKRLWTIFSVMNVINAGLFAVVTVKETSNFLQIIAAFLGIGLCIIWRFAVNRMVGWVRLWERRLRMIERLYLAKVNQNLLNQSSISIPANFRIFIGRQRQNPYRQGIPTRSAGQLLPLLFLVVWFVILVSLLLPQLKLLFVLLWTNYLKLIDIIIP